MSDDESIRLNRAVNKGDLLAVRHWLEDSGAARGSSRAAGQLLLLAAQSGHTPIVELLLGAGAPVEGPNPGGYTPLVAGALFGSLGAVKALLRAGAHVPQFLDGRNLIELVRQSGSDRTEIIGLLSAEREKSRGPAA